ncbi:MAG: hypothetical protein H6636_01965 [Anaerolineales bacterium]|nr:hypothetical protein [Anaerolineales bacterium]
MLKRLFLAILRLTLGVILGGVLLEGVLHVNTSLLLRGMAVPAPVDAPLTESEYDVFTSDADLFYWHADLIHPIPEQEDEFEAHVRFETDEFGFPNAAPLPATVDVAILGRSYSLGAQASEPWPIKLSATYHFQVLNLSQTGSGIDTKISYLERFGWLRKPRWVILEVLPSMDILGYAPSIPSVVQQLPSPIIRALWKSYGNHAEGLSDRIYPIDVDIPGQTVPLTFFSYYLSALTVGQERLKVSEQWSAYSAQVLALQAAAQIHSACVVLLYVPTKEDIYFSLATQPAQLEPLLPLVTPWVLGKNENTSQTFSIAAMQANVYGARDVLRDFAVQHHIVLVDPTVQLEEAALKGTSPYMRYDTHWSDLGHSIIANMVAETLQQSSCP